MLQNKGYSFEVLISDDLLVSGAILSNQIKNLDWNIQDAKWICTLPPQVVVEVLQKLGTLLS